jgi:hypothetical protein
MAAPTASRHPPQRRVENIKSMLADIGSQQRKVMHLFLRVFHAHYLLFAVGCIAAGAFAASNGRLHTAAVWGSVGIVLVLVWLSAKGLTRSMRKHLRALKDEMDGLPSEIERECRRNSHRGPRDHGRHSR